MRHFSFILIFTLTNTLSYCCSCSDFKPEIDSAWNNSDQIFIGKVIDIDTSSRLFGSFGQPVYTFTLEILESYKDTVFFNWNKRTILDFGRFGAGSCDYTWFEKDSIYLVYSRYRTMGFLNINKCGRTDRLSNIENDELEHLKFLKNEVKRQLLSRDSLNPPPPPPPPKSMHEDILLRDEINTVIWRNNFYLRTIKVLSGVSGFLFILTVFLMFKIKRKK